ncbi:MAG: GMC family oxidoreductase N-terminal domain-containing protein [Deltaproteobacteria bacterium]|nr:GMC family oxidoreductase N-terminal domain-containing protein [Deltaproteobacteria bacterium]
MIYDAAALPLPLRLKADLCVIGSGAGGGMVATVAAEAGLKVVVLEAGALWTPAMMSQREEEMFPRLLWDNGSRTTTDRAVKIHQGRGIGGSTLHNTCLCKRIPDPILRRWQAERKLETLDAKRWADLYGRVETKLAIADIPEAQVNRHNRLLLDGARKLGWRTGTLKHNRTGCAASGFCEMGCAFDAKNNVLKTLVPRIVRAGADLLSNCQAVRVTHGAAGVTGVDAVAVHARNA